MTDSPSTSAAPPPSSGASSQASTCPVCGIDLDQIDIRAHHDFHFNLNQPIQNWSTLSKQQSDQLLKLASERTK